MQMNLLCMSPGQGTYAIIIRFECMDLIQEFGIFFLFLVVRDLLSRVEAELD